MILAQLACSRHIFWLEARFQGLWTDLCCPARRRETATVFTCGFGQEFVVMVVDRARSHKAKDLMVPENVRLIRLPGYSPELNPQEQVWDEVREKAFPNLVLD